MTITLRTGAALVAVAVLAGCSTMRSPDPRDPWEGLNRATYEFNDGFDKVLLKPVAEGYRFVLPTPARTAVTNFFANLKDPWIALNQLMQGKPRLAIDDLGRFVWNSTFGLLGLIDVASDMGLPKHNEDFGQTLAVWGADFGPYLVLPILGPSSVRDGVGLIPDAYAYLPWQIPKWADFEHRVTWQWSLTGLDLVQTRANLLDASDLLEEAALDRYAFLRNAYFQRRRHLIYDGDPPPLPADKQSSVTPVIDPAPPGQLVEPRMPANYPAVLAADAPRTIAAR
ncbi:MAG: VacJ family lipoprotein [Bacteroidota bacterium]|jgi:phospholipid-binding lipoprotein MlaA